MERSTWLLAALCLATGTGAAAQGGKAGDEGTGALLYSTHCVACHSAQVHWRDGKRVVNWATLLAEVRRWQSNAGLAWGDDEILAVARHLNALHYRVPEPAHVASRR